jgi:hypothetical protein
MAKVVTIKRAYSPGLIRGLPIVARDRLSSHDPGSLAGKGGGEGNTILALWPRKGEIAKIVTIKRAYSPGLTRGLPIVARDRLSSHDPGSLAGKGGGREHDSSSSAGKGERIPDKTERQPYDFFKISFSRAARNFTKSSPAW